jgi:hypothetical protein
MMSCLTQHSHLSDVCLSYVIEWNVSLGIHSFHRKLKCEMKTFLSSQLIGEVLGPCVYHLLIDLWFVGGWRVLFQHLIFVGMGL